ncbi:MAG: hypothetical protein GXO32_06915 [Crenarchaeota archaeon]|nr:hypothetical protein [Thermoproteota archaeon]
MKARMTEIIGQYVAVEIDLEGALKLLERLHEVTGKGGEDLQDTIRMIRNFDAFYEFMRKKFKDYLTPKKNISEMIKGLVLVDKIKLVKKDDGKYVVIIFDRSVPKDTIEEALKNLGYEYEVESKSLY